MRKERIEKAVDIINYAVINQMSVKEASVKCGYADTYVKNIKAIVYEEYKNGNLEDELFSLFNNAYEEYKYYRGFGVRRDDEPNPVQLTDTSIPSFVKNQTAGGEKLSVDGDGHETTIEWVSGSNYPADHVKTLPQLLKTAQIDENIWKVKDYVINKWDVTSMKTDFPITVQNWQVKARLEKDVKLSDMIDIEKMFKNMAKTYQPPVLDWTPEKKKKNTENNLLEISIFDLHMGKLAWAGETFENYDTKIARERFMSSIEKLLHRAGGFEFSAILFPIGNDFFNSDTILNTTTKGTPQDEDLRWQKTFNVGVQLLVDAINLLKQTGVPVDVLVIPGNHDFERSYYMGKYLEAWFNNDPQVNINNHASPRKYYRFGNVLLGFTHGGEEREGSLPMIMATDIESKPMWSETKYHEWHLGHQHRKKTIKYSILDKSQTLNEDLGVTVRYLSSLTGTEEWHHKKGFIGQIKAADAFIWNDELGLVAILNSNLNKQ
jgi:hypothetical protein